MPESFRALLERYGEENPPELRLGAYASAEDFGDWQRRFRRKLNELRGPDLSRPEATVRVLDVSEQPDHWREHITIDSVLGTRVPAYVLVPKDIADGGKRAGVLALHGHVESGKERVSGALYAEEDPVPRDYGLAAVRAGFVTLCPDWWGWGERVEEGVKFGRRDPCNVKFFAAAMYGLPLLSIMIGDGLAALDALVFRNDVDASHIGVMGNSFGGRMSMWLAALDERIACAVCSGCANTFRERSLKLSSCGSQFLPGLLRWGDVPEILALIAPRPLMVTSGAQDRLLNRTDVEQMGQDLLRAYEASGAKDNLNWHGHPGGHVLPQTEALAWLGKNLGMLG